MKKLGVLISMLIMSVMLAVSANAVLTTSISVPSMITIYQNEFTAINPTFKPDNVTDKSFTIKGSDYTYSYKVFILGGMLGTTTKTETCKFSDYVYIADDNSLMGIKPTVEPRTDKEFYFEVTITATDGSGATATTLVKVRPYRHEQVSFSGKAATCTESGYNPGIKCKICGITLSGGETIPAFGHKYSDNYTVDVAATCTKTGVKSRHCFYCNQVKDTTTIPKTGHNYTEIVIDATCTQEGQKVNVCICGDKYGETIPAKGHNMNGSECTDCDYKAAVQECSCKCHKKGITGFFWKIRNFFNKLFKKNPTCICSVAHY